MDDMYSRHPPKWTPGQGVPESVPSIVDIKSHMPAYCFRPSLLTSLYYVLKDLAIISALYLTMFWIDSNVSSGVLRHACLPVYWYLQGTMFWAVFVLGHDCGHGSFSNYPCLNDVIGNLLHATILVPYYPWKLSHKKHHKNTGNMDKDEIFYPVRSKTTKKFIPLLGFGLSWFVYLYKGYAPRASNHLNPFDPLFSKHVWNCVQSLAACAAWILLVLLPYASHLGLQHLVRFYVLPLFVFASWLVVTTFLHHQDEDVPWYADRRWDNVRGQLSSVDRHYGWAHGLVHNIGTHQIHHLFSMIPHYHLEEATRSFRLAFPHLVRESREPILQAFVRRFGVFNENQLVRGDADVHFFKKAGKKET